MIVQVLQGYSKAHHAGSLWGVLADRLARSKVPDGRLSATFGRQVHADGTESFVYVTTWRDMESIYAWVGGRDLIGTPRLLRGLESMIDGFDVQHYIAPELGEAPVASAPDRPSERGTAVPPVGASR